MADVTSELLALKDQALAATKARDQDFYDGYLADDAIAILPAGVFDKTAIVAALGAPTVPFQSSEIKETRVVVLGPDAGVVIYRATLAAGDVMTTTIYARRDGVWRGVLYQQTPMASG